MLKILPLIILIAGFILFRPIEDFPKTFPKFETVDLDGNIFTEKIFDRKITAIVLWTTDSEPCLEIVKNLDEDLPKNFQIIGLIGNKNFDSEIVKKFSKIKNLQVNDDFYPILSKIKTVPTVIFIDRHGNLIEPPQFVSNAKFIREELIRISEINSPKNKLKNSLQKIFW